MYFVSILCLFCVYFVSIFTCTYTLTHTLSPPHPQHQVTKEYPSAREALVVNGKFLLRQLTALDTKTNDKGKGKAGASLKDCTFASALTKEVDIASTARRNATGTIVIHDVQANAEEGAAMTDAQAADEEFARQLQAKLDAEEMARSRGR